MIVLVTWFKDGERDSRVDDLSIEMAKTWAQEITDREGVYAQLSTDGRFYLLTPGLDNACQILPNS